MRTLETAAGIFGVPTRPFSSGGSSSGSLMQLAGANGGGGGGGLAALRNGSRGQLDMAAAADGGGGVLMEEQGGEDGIRIAHARVVARPGVHFIAHELCRERLGGWWAGPGALHVSFASKAGRVVIQRQRSECSRQAACVRRLGQSLCANLCRRNWPACCCPAGRPRRVRQAAAAEREPGGLPGGGLLAGERTVPGVERGVGGWGWVGARCDEAAPDDGGGIDGDGHWT